MRKLLFTATLALCTLGNGFGQSSLDYYLPASSDLDPNVPTPQSVLGHDVGDWHVSHDKLVQYMHEIARVSDRVIMEEYARSHENRPLLTLKISSPSNLQDLENLRAEHLKLSDFNQSSNLAIDQMPLVAYLGYSIHGDEPSGSNAALLAAYYLAAARGDEIESWLEQMIIIIDPCYNPDGLNRYASWANSSKSKNPVLVPGHSEHNEPWPTGRTNHYWFDLNRDWLPVQHPESQGRVAHFHHWKPNVLTDHHEMGPNSTYFFQPGIPSRNNPLTPSKTYELTERIAGYHAKALDQTGSQYYSKESFDDFYVGKGSSYPDVNGSIGILFEQAGAEGQAQKTSNGTLTFNLGIKNHLSTSLSTLKAAFELRTEILSHQRQFYADIPDLANKLDTKAYVFQVSKNLSKLRAFLTILETHQIEVYRLGKSIADFDSNDSFIVPLKQQQFRMVQALFETRTQFKDSLFYDVSAWTLPLAFDIDFKKVTTRSFSGDLLGNRIQAKDIRWTDLSVEPNAYAYAFHWQDSQAPAMLYNIQKAGILAKVATEPWTSASESFERGSMIIPIQNQELSGEFIHQLLKRLSLKHGIPITALETGDTGGFQLGSPKFRKLTMPKPILVMGSGTNAYEAGEVWHLLDQRIGMAVPMITQSRLNSMDLSAFDQIIMVNGNYGTLNQAKLKSWVQQGGSIIAIRSAGKWVSESGLSKTKYTKVKKDSTKQFLPYGQRNRALGAQRIGGTIFEVRLDLTHPINFGFPDDRLPLLKKGVQIMEPTKNPYAQPAYYTKHPLIAGYVSKENLSYISDSPAISLSAYGKGLVISINDNPNFRGYWYGSNRVFLNALFFENIIEAGSAR